MTYSQIKQLAIADPHPVLPNKPKKKAQQNCDLQMIFLMYIQIQIASI